MFSFVLAETHYIPVSEEDKLVLFLGRLFNIATDGNQSSETRFYDVEFEYYQYIM